LSFSYFAHLFSLCLTFFMHHSFEDLLVYLVHLFSMDIILSTMLLAW
jgi:hypothetical protein